MKYLYINGELAGEAEKILVNEQKRQIVGYNGDSDIPSFAMRGVKFENITYEIKDDAGKAIEANMDVDQELYEAIEQAQDFEGLKKALLGQTGKAKAKGKPV